MIKLDLSTERLILKALEEKDLSSKAIQGLLVEGYYKTQIFLEQLKQEGKIILIPRTKHHSVWRLCKDDGFLIENDGVEKGDEPCLRCVLDGEKVDCKGNLLKEGDENGNGQEKMENEL